MSDTSFEIEPAGDAILGPCPDCGRQTKQIWGYVADRAGARAAYFIRWTEGHLDRGAQLLLSIGNWGPNADPAERSCLGIECRGSPTGPQFMVVNANDLPWQAEAFLGAMLSREAARGDSRLSREAFSILDRILESDARFRRFITGEEPGRG